VGRHGVGIAPCSELLINLVLSSPKTRKIVGSIPREEVLELGVGFVVEALVSSFRDR
jgi:hypothetical protein